MGVYIPKMEMPRNCSFCPCARMNISRNGIECSAVDFYAENLMPQKERMKCCPLVEVKPHGRLIDADALTDAIELIDWYHQNKNKDMVEGANSDEEQAWYREQDIYAAIEDAPTIIEAEEDEECGLKLTNMAISM